MKTIEDIDELIIDRSKFMADGTKYFELFEKHVPTGLTGNILIFTIGNLDCISKLMSLNKDAKYLVVENSWIIRSLTTLFDGELDIDAIECDGLDMYNIIKEIDMKFDCIIMNPPYQRNLHLKILAEAIKHLSDDGICVNLSPVVWLANYNINRPMSKYRKVFNGKLKRLETIDHATANGLFGTGNSIEELGIYTLKNDDSSGLDLENYGFKTDAEKTLFSKIDMMNPKAGVITFNKCKYNDNYGSVAGVRKPHDVVIYTWHGGNNCRDAVVREAGDKVSAVLYFKNTIERQNFLNSLDTTFMNWYWRMFVVPGDNKIINYMFRMSDYSKPWDDSRFYKFFNITPEEQKVIEDTMNKYDTK